MSFLIIPNICGASQSDGSILNVFYRTGALNRILVICQSIRNLLPFCRFSLSTLRSLRCVRCHFSAEFSCFEFK